MTYNVKMDTNNGHIEFLDKAEFDSAEGTTTDNFSFDRSSVNKIFEKI